MRKGSWQIQPSYLAIEAKPILFAHKHNENLSVLDWKDRLIEW